MFVEMYAERMALEANLRREKLTREAEEFHALRPYRPAARWQVWLFSRLGDWLVARGTALQQRYHSAEARLAFSEYTPPNPMERAL